MWLEQLQDSSEKLANALPKAWKVHLQIFEEKCILLEPWV